MSLINFSTQRLTVLAVCMMFPLLAFGQDSLPDLEQKADSLYALNEDESALEYYEEILENNPDNFQALWRTSFLYSRIGDRFDDEENQEEYFNQAIKWAEKALEADSAHSQSNYVMSVAMGRKALISGARDRVAASREIKKYADRAIQYDSTNAGAWHVLGRWHLKVANLGWVEKAAANTLFGGLPGDASTDRAAKLFEKAISLNDERLLYRYDLARAYEELDQEEKAIAACEKVEEMPVMTPDDDQIKRDCRELSEDLR